MGGINYKSRYTGYYYNALDVVVNKDTNTIGIMGHKGTAAADEWREPIRESINLANPDGTYTLHIGNYSNIVCNYSPALKNYSFDSADVSEFDARELDYDIVGKIINAPTFNGDIVGSIIIADNNASIVTNDDYISLGDNNYQTITKDIDGISITKETRPITYLGRSLASYIKVTEGLVANGFIR
jgi:hypothetical protein